MNETFEKVIASDKKKDAFKYIMSHIHSDTNGTIIEKWDREGILQQILPYMNELKTVGKCRYHIDDAFTHMNYVYKNFKRFLKGEIKLKGINPEMFSRKVEGYSVGDYTALAAFTHDIGKYKAFKKRGENISFKGHEVIGSEIMKDVCERYNFPKEAEDIIVRLIEAHMYPLNISKNCNSYEVKVEFFQRYEDLVPYILSLAYCDMEGKRIFDTKYEEKNAYKKEIEKIFFEYSTFINSKG